MKKFILYLFIFQCTHIFSQTSSEVLEHGIKINKDQNIFLRIENDEIEYSIGRATNNPNLPLKFNSLGDSIIIQVPDINVNVFLLPYNPLVYSYKTEIKNINDPIYDNTQVALESVIDVLNTTKLAQTQGVVATYDTCNTFNAIENNLIKIQNRLKVSKKEEMLTVFKKLKSISFLLEQKTIQDFNSIKNEKSIIDKYFLETDSIIKNTFDQIKKYDCNKTNSTVTKFIFSSYLKDLKEIQINKKKRLTGLNKAVVLVNEMINKSIEGDGQTGLKWCFKLDGISISNKKVSLYSITLYKGIVSVSENEEIADGESKEIVKKTLRIKKFRRFITEVSVGTAFTSFKYNTYTTTSDSIGNSFVSEPVENVIENLNFSTMINFNYFIPNSPIHPLYQLGIGVNSGIPTLFTGIGIRSNSGLKRISVSGGLAMTWIKELQELKVGDKLENGASELENDLAYKFSWPPKFYLGLQYNF